MFWGSYLPLLVYSVMEKINTFEFEFLLLRHAVPVLFEAVMLFLLQIYCRFTSWDISLTKNGVSFILSTVN